MFFWIRLSGDLIMELGERVELATTAALHLFLPLACAANVAKLADVVRMSQVVLSSTIEDVYARNDLPRTPITLANMRHCLTAVGRASLLKFGVATLKSKNRNGKGCNSESQYEQQVHKCEFGPKPAAMFAEEDADTMLRAYDDAVLEFFQVDI
ncbi:root UVB sensitive 6-like protein isoform X1 [Tanacetum coccineum]